MLEREEAPSGGGAEATQPRGRHRVQIADTKLDKILTDPNGRIQYAFTVDKDGKSACYGQCAKAWPALTMRDPSAGEDVQASLLGTATRTDGSA